MQSECYMRVYESLSIIGLDLRLKCSVHCLDNTNVDNLHQLTPLQVIELGQALLHLQPVGLDEVLCCLLEVLG